MTLKAKEVTRTEASVSNYSARQDKMRGLLDGFSTVSATETNIFYNVNKYIFQLRQILFTI